MFRWLATGHQQVLACQNRARFWLARSPTSQVSPVVPKPSHGPETGVPRASPWTPSRGWIRPVALPQPGLGSRTPTPPRGTAPRWRRSPAGPAGCTTARSSPAPSSPRWEPSLPPSQSLPHGLPPAPHPSGPQTFSHAHQIWAAVILGTWCPCPWRETGRRVEMVLFATHFPGVFFPKPGSKLGCLCLGLKGFDERRPPL